MYIFHPFQREVWLLLLGAFLVTTLCYLLMNHVVCSVDGKGGTKNQRNQNPGPENRAAWFCVQTWLFQCEQTISQLPFCCIALAFLNLHVSLTQTLFWCVVSAGTYAPNHSSTRFVAAAISLCLLAMKAAYSGTLIASLAGKNTLVHIFQGLRWLVYLLTSSRGGLTFHGHPFVQECWSSTIILFCSPVEEFFHFHCDVRRITVACFDRYCDRILSARVDV